MTTKVDRTALNRNEHLTFRANMGVGRHGWLRLTPAYGVRLVRERLQHLPKGAVITDPFSGTGTTALGAAELGLIGQSVDVNPFLVWLGNVKVAHYNTDALLDVADRVSAILSDADSTVDSDGLWQPNMFKIEKWWSPGSLHALKVLRHGIDRTNGQVRDLLELALCRTLIGCSNAAFNHQSMSFKKSASDQFVFDPSHIAHVYKSFKSEASALIECARFDLAGEASVHIGDSRSGVESLKIADFVLTSPPYVNRMSYIRELRPYMYWLRYLEESSDAGEMDWQAIGGTWGIATSKLTSWEPTTDTPIDNHLKRVCSLISGDGGKNGSLLATYVHKYHHDMWLHFQTMTEQLSSDGRVSYIIGNSTFYKHEVPAHRWYAEMLAALGYEDVQINVIRKRNSNKALFEYEVTGSRGCV